MTIPIRIGEMMARVASVPVPIELGFFSFTEVDPPSEHRAYNEWHQLDHLPEQYGIDGVRHGERWVASPDCAAARLPGGDDGLARSHYVTLYLFAPPLAASLQEFRDLAVELRAADRFHRFRHAHLAGAFDVVHRIAAPRVLVRAEVLPWRPATGAYVVVDDGLAPPEPAELVVDGVAGGWTFRTSAAHVHPSWPTRDCSITVLWIDGDPLDVAESVAPVLARRAVPPAYAGPLRTVVPGQWDWFERAPGVRPGRRPA